MSVATPLSYDVLQYWICIGQHNKTLAHLLNIHGRYKAMSLELNKVGLTGFNQVVNVEKLVLSWLLICLR